MKFQYLNLINDETIKTLVTEYFEFRETGLMPSKSGLRKVMEAAAEELGTSFSTLMDLVMKQVLEYAAQKVL